MKTKKIQCMVCEESPIVTLPALDIMNDGEEVYCPVCEKWLATAHDHLIYKNQKYWSCEDDTYYNEETGETIKNYPIKYIL